MPDRVLMTADMTPSRFVSTSCSKIGVRDSLGSSASCLVRYPTEYQDRDYADRHQPRRPVALSGIQNLQCRNRSAIGDENENRADEVLSTSPTTLLPAASFFFGDHGRVGLPSVPARPSFARPLSPEGEEKTALTHLPKIRLPLFRERLKCLLRLRRFQPRDETLFFLFDRGGNRGRIPHQFLDRFQRARGL